MQIIRPTEKIEVIESKKQCKTGSAGYLVYQQPLDIYNMCRSLIVFTKFGNKGKNRIEVMDITTEMVDIASMKLTTKAREILKERITKGNIMPKYVDKFHTINSSIKKVPMLSKSIVDLDIWDFFGYICSLSLFMKSLTAGAYTRLGLLDRDNLSIAEVHQTRIIDVPPINLASFIYLALNCSKLAGVDGVDARGLSSLYMDHFNSTHNRAACMDKMYLLLSTLREGVLRYSNYIIASHRDMSNRIKSVIANKKESSKLKAGRVDMSKLGIRLEQLERPERAGPRPPQRPRPSHRDEACTRTEPAPNYPNYVGYGTSSSRSSGTNPSRAANPRPRRADDMGTWEARHEEEGRDIENR